MGNGNRTRRWRPAPGGVSVGHVDITAGTLGAWFDTKNKGLVMLSNNHVLANSNGASIDDHINQPGPYDDASPTNWIATLKDFIPIHFDNGDSLCPLPFMIKCINGLLSFLHRSSRLTIVAEQNKVDAAIAVPLDEEDAELIILEVGKIRGIKPATTGMRVKKSGRTTGLNRGEIIAENVTVQVSYGDRGIATFIDQLVTTKLAEGGDSGSLVLEDDQKNNAIGLLFAGSDTQTIINRIENVLEELDIEPIFEE